MKNGHEIIINDLEDFCPFILLSEIQNPLNRVYVYRKNYDAVEFLNGKKWEKDKNFYLKPGEKVIVLEFSPKVFEELEFREDKIEDQKKCLQEWAESMSAEISALYELIYNNQRSIDQKKESLAFSLSSFQKISAEINSSN